MATFPPLPQIVGKHGGIYEAYYIQADPQGTGSIGALDAANFLKKSKLKDTVLSQIWDLSDPMGKGYLEKSGFFVALKLIALVQNSQELSTSKLSFETTAPDLGPVEPVDPSSQSTVSPNVPWDISVSEKSSYDKVFDSLNPMNNMLGGDKVKPVLMNSKLPVDVLGRIWDLSDINKDGFLDRDEFAVAMHLVYQAREGHETPAILKPGLVPPSKRKGAGMGASVPLPSTSLPGAVPVLPMGVPPKGGATVSPPTWVVSANDKINSEVIFKKLDTDLDGLVSGLETRDVMAQSGLPTTVLAQIWGLCDIQNQGKLTSDQFALAMYLIQQALKGVEPPAQLTPEMIPPSQRTTADLGAFGVRDGTNSGPYSHCADFSAIKELDQISKDIEDIKKEKLQLERDKAQQEADIKIRQSEVLVLQKELDSLNVTLTQLDSQKKEAQKRLDELDDKRSNLERNVKEMRDKTETEQMEVNKMKSLLCNRDQMIKDQEAELTNLRKELIELRDEESKLEQTVDSSKQQLEQLGKSHQGINDQINQTKTRIQQLKDQYKGVENGFGSFNGDTTITTNVISSIDKPAMVTSNFGTSSNMDGFKDDPFKGQDPFGNSGIGSDTQADPFHNEDPFKDNDPFKASEPFGSDDPFKDAFGSSSQTKSDPFGNIDPFGGSQSSSIQKSGDSFDAFGASWGTNAAPKSSQSSAGGFTSDPFGDSKPSLPAKQKKAPPPRPAPPKSKSPLPTGHSPAKPKVDPFADFDSDPFSGSGASKTSSNSDPFANFADFSPGKFNSDNDSSPFGGGGPSTITIKESHSPARPQPAKRHIMLNSASTEDSTDA